jgi:hypothetical protein
MADPWELRAQRINMRVIGSCGSDLKTVEHTDAGCSATGMPRSGCSLLGASIWCSGDLKDWYFYGLDAGCEMVTRIARD